MYFLQTILKLQESRKSNPLHQKLSGSYYFKHHVNYTNITLHCKRSNARFVLKAERLSSKNDGASMSSTIF